MDLLEFELDNEKYTYLNGTANFIFKSDQVNPIFFLGGYIYQESSFPRKRNQ